MYDDPANIRDNQIKARFTDREFELVKALANFNQRLPAVFVRELVMNHIAALQNNSNRDAKSV